MMSAGAVLIGLAMLILILFFILSPALEKERGDGAAQPLGKHSVGDGRKKILYAIRELDFDYQTGKVAPEDYEYTRMDLVSGAAALVEKENQEQEHLEKMIRARKDTVGSTVCPRCGEDTEAGICPRCEACCPNCGKKTDLDFNYCTACGTRL